MYTSPAVFGIAQFRILQTLCCWTTDACDVSGASSQSAWQERSHLSVTFLGYLIMIRSDDVVTSCKNVV